MGIGWRGTGLGLLLALAPDVHAAAPVITPADEGVWPLQGRDQARFLRSVRADLDRRGLSYTVLRGAVQLVADGQVTTLGLYNLAARCAVVSKSACGPLVTDHFDNVLATQDDTDALSAAIAQGLEATLPRLRIMLWHPDAVPAHALAGLATRPVAPGLIAVLAWDSELTTGTVTADQLAALGVPLEAVWDRLLENHATDTVRAAWSVGNPGSDAAVPVLTLETGDAYAATHLFRLDVLRDRPPPEGGWLVALPSRSYVLAVPLDEPQPQAVPYLLAVVHEDPGLERRPLSSELYWVHQGVWTHLPATADGLGVQGLPPFSAPAPGPAPPAPPPP